MSWSNWTRWLVIGLLALVAIVLTGCAGGGDSSPVTTVVDQAVGWITGLVTKSRGEPISNATVTLEETGDRTTTNSQGQFSLNTARRGTGTLRAEASDYLTLRWPVDTSSGGASGLQLHLVTMRDYSQSLFEELATAGSGGNTWRWAAGTITYYVDHGGAYRPEFDATLHQAFDTWSMLTQRTITFSEGSSSAPLQIGYVTSNPLGCGSSAVGCAGPTRVSASGQVQGAVIEYRSDYATNINTVEHEIGHTLAFTGHSSNPTDLMYAYVNGSTSPSNAEAAAASVLYSNPPGTTAANIRLPSTQAQSASAPAVVVPVTAAPSLPATMLPEPVQPPPAYSSLGGIGEMVRAWLESLTCLIGLPGVCSSGPWPVRGW